MYGFFNSKCVLFFILLNYFKLNFVFPVCTFMILYSFAELVSELQPTIARKHLF